MTARLGARENAGLDSHHRQRLKMSAPNHREKTACAREEPSQPGPRWGELIASALLALTGIATSWSSYQASRWGGVQAQEYGSASALRVTSSREFTKAGQIKLIDIISFEGWAGAYASGNVELQVFYRTRFRSEFRPAFEAWLALRPLQDGNAPPTPFAMPQYRLAAYEQASRLELRADASARAAREASAYSDGYVRLAVLFATVMLFAGISQQFRIIRLRFVLLALALVLLIYGTTMVVSYPRA